MSFNDKPMTAGRAVTNGHHAIILAAGVLDIALAVALGNWFHQLGVAVAVVLAEVFIAGATHFTLSRRRLNPWGGVAEQEEVVA